MGVMSKVDQRSTTESAKENDNRSLVEELEIDRIASLAVKEAQEENRRLGIPNYYEIDGRIVSEED